MDLLRIIIAIILPPLGVFMQVGFSGAFCLNILLTLYGLYSRHHSCSLGNCASLSFASSFTLMCRKITRSNVHEG